ncbi:MAG: tetratricopeptide repeat protein [Acidobacteriaceae bacterium]|jgi:hypothetical protein|nr:tetratricopeptide repeat protein [Acidobacteriaceae bacterium]
MRFGNIANLLLGRPSLLIRSTYDRLQTPKRKWIISIALRIVRRRYSSKHERRCSNPSLVPALSKKNKFDFWVGSWDLTWPGTKAGEFAHGTNTIKRIMDGCIIQENFSGGAKRNERFDLLPQEKRWKQTSVDNEGGYLDSSAVMKAADDFVLREQKPHRWSPHANGVQKHYTSEFDWSWEKSTDEGKSWQVVWPIHYKRKS